MDMQRLASAEAHHAVGAATACTELLHLAIAFELLMKRHSSNAIWHNLQVSMPIRCCTTWLRSPTATSQPCCASKGRRQTLHGATGVWSPGGLRTPPNSTSLNLVRSRRVLAGRTQSYLGGVRSWVDRRWMYEIQLTRPRSGYFERRERTERSSKTLASTPSTSANFSTIVMLAL
jgi:hypothetical protein